MGPLGPYLNAAWLWATGLPAVEGIRWAGTLNAIACGWLLDRIARRFLASDLRILLQGVYVLGVAFPGALGRQGGIWTPYSFGYAYGLTWGMLAIWAGLRHLEDGRRRWLVLLGLSGAAALLSKIDAFGAALLAGVALAWSSRSFAVAAWMGGAFLLFAGAGLGLLLASGVAPRDLMESVLPLTHFSSLIGSQPRWTLVQPGDAGGAACLALVLGTLWAWRRRDDLPLWGKAALAAAWAACLAMQGKLFFLRAMESHAALATWAFAAWAFSPGGKAEPRDRLLAAAAVGAWVRLLIELSAVPLGWTARPLHPVLLVAGACFWLKAVPGWSAARGRERFGLDGAAAGRILRTALAALCLLGAVRAWRNLAPNDLETVRTPLGSLRIRKDPAGTLWLRTAEKVRAWGALGERTVQIPGDDLLLAAGQPPPLPYGDLDILIAGREEAIVERLRRDPAIRHVVIVYRDSEYFWFGQEYGSRLADYLDAEWEADGGEAAVSIPFRLLTRERQRLAGDRITVYFLRRKD